MVTLLTGSKPGVAARLLPKSLRATNMSIGIVTDTAAALPTIIKVLLETPASNSCGTSLLKMAEPKRKAYRTKCAFGDTAPAYTLPFPKKANLTAVEILAFLPNSIKRADVVYRMISNGGTRKSIYTIVNTHRDLGAEWSANCCGEAMYKTMQKAGFTKWTIKRHHLWHADRKASWDRTKLDVGDLQTVHGVPGRDVSFRTLADNVRMMPEGHDALDLTKMIQYCVQNPEDEWRYPQDYEELLDLLGGPAEVREENADEAVFGRWEDRKPPPPIAKPTLPSRGIEPLDEGTETGRRVNVGDKPCTERLSMLSPRSGSLIRSKTAVRIAQTGTESVADGGLTAETLPNGGCGTPYVREPVSAMPRALCENVHGWARY